MPAHNLYLIIIKTYKICHKNPVTPASSLISYFPVWPGSQEEFEKNFNLLLWHNFGAIVEFREFVVGAEFPEFMSWVLLPLVLYVYIAISISELQTRGRRV